MFVTKRKRKNTGVFYTSESKKPKSISITKKGNRKVVDLDKLEKVIIDLSNNPTAKIKTLKGKLAHSYRQAITYVELFYGHEHYQILLELIEKHFKKHKKVIPGTIGAYMYGCSVNTNLDNDACSPLCAGSIKLDPDAPFCDLPVVIASYSKSSFEFYLKNDNNHQRTAFVHVTFSSIRTFPGFTDKEKDWFRRYNIKNIYLYGSVNNSGKYVNLYSDKNSDGTVSIEDVKPRIGVVKPTQTKLNTNTAIISVLSIVVLLFFVYFIYKYMTASRRHKKY